MKKLLIYFLVLLTGGLSAQTDKPRQLFRNMERLGVGKIPVGRGTGTDVGTTDLDSINTNYWGNAFPVNARRKGNRWVNTADTVDGFFLSENVFIASAVKTSVVPPRTATNGGVTISYTNAVWRRTGLSINTAQTIQFVYTGTSWKPSRVLFPSDFGAIGDGVTNDYNALKAFFDFHRTEKITANLDGQSTYATNREIDVSGVNLSGNGARIVAIYTTMNSTTHPNYSVVSAVNGTRSTLGTASQNVFLQGRVFAKVSFSLTTVKENDFLLIQDNTDFSFSQYASYDKDGQYIEVLRTSNDTIFFKTSILKTIVNSSTVFKANYNSYTVSNVNITGTGLPALNTLERVFYAKNNLKSEFVGINASNSAYMAIEAEDDIESVFENCKAVKTSPDLGEGLSYGFSVTSCHGTAVKNGNFYGARHGVAMGVRTVPVYGVVVSESTIQSTQNLAADFHPAVRFSAYRDCKISNGVAMGGFNNTIEDCVIRSGPLYNGIFFTDGGNRTIRNNTFITDSIFQGGFLYSSHTAPVTKTSEVITGNTFIFEGAKKPVIDAVFLSYINNTDTLAEVSFTNNVFRTNYDLKVVFYSQSSVLQKLDVSNNVFLKTGVFLRNVFNISLTNNRFEYIQSLSPIEFNYLNLTGDVMFLQNRNLFIGNSFNDAYFCLNKNGSKRLVQNNNTYYNTYTLGSIYNTKARLYNFDTVSVTMPISCQTETADFYLEACHLRVKRYDNCRNGLTFSAISSTLDTL